MKRLLFAVCILFTVPTFAVLSPLNQSIVEIKKIVDELGASQLIPQDETIKAIAKVEEGYLIETDNYLVLAQLNYQENSKPGPKKFNLQFRYLKPKHY